MNLTHSYSVSSRHLVVAEDQILLFSPTEMDRPEEKSSVNSQLWLACAGTTACLPRLRSTVFYFPQGHLDHALPSFSAAGPTVLPFAAPPFVPCRVAAVRLHARPHTDELFASLQLLPLNHTPDCYDDLEGGGADQAAAEEEEKLPSFSKTLTPSDANNGGGFSVPRYCAETIFPKLDYSVEPPMQTLTARDVHGVLWRFRHIYRGTPRRHLLTTGWSFFVSQKKLVAGDSVVFVLCKGGDISIGIRRARRLETRMKSFIPPFGGFQPVFEGQGRVEEVALAVERAGRGVEFEVEYYPRRRSPPFVVDVEAVRAATRVRWCSGMRVKMPFETDDSARVSWFKGTVSAVNLVDPVNSPHSPWRILQVVWDEPDLVNVKSVNPWQVELASSEPKTAAHNLLPFSPYLAKRIRIPQNPEFLFKRQFLIPSSSDDNSLGPSRTHSAVIQGARHSHLGDSLWKYQLHTINNVNKMQTGLVHSASQEQPCQSLSAVADGEKPAQLLLFGQKIVIEQQSLPNTLDLNVSELQHSDKLVSKVEIEEGSEMPFPGQGTGQCQVFLDIENVGRCIDLMTLDSYAELYERLAEVFEVKQSDVFACAPYRDSSGAVKRMGDEPYSIFRRTTTSLTILLGSRS